ncbi:hypothetical protein [Rheinheimera aquimaris]|uniref:hypothetical protein n=1 Tax=Rheinheimera aquimaris TaxID=412437 RepID=UPI001E613869|nr:hypothetical protein [Rheinheimera aquimaris]MCD1597883.1 hypothetical protein [Rheinheimera aquimaris]
MKRILLLAAVAVGVFSFVPVSVTGSVYVVTQGMGTVAMPMTEVKIYDAAEFSKALEAKKVDYLTHCSHLPSADYMQELELRALKGGPEAVSQYAEYRDKIEACSTVTFVSSAEYLTPIETVTTDKNGEFQFKVNRYKDVVVMADGKRAVGLGEETYVWLKKYEPSISSFSARLELNNHNEISNTTMVDLSI